MLSERLTAIAQRMKHIRNEAFHRLKRAEAVELGVMITAIEQVARDAAALESAIATIPHQGQVS